MLFNIAVAISAFLGGWVLNNISSAIKQLDADVRRMPHQYVGKDDYRSDMRDVKELLTRIDTKLDNKVDKS